MLCVIRDRQNHLQAVCEWWLVDDQGSWMPQGRYVWLNQLEANPGMNLHTIRRYLVEEIGRLAPEAVGVYWERRDRFSQRLHAFRRDQLQQLREEVGV